MSDPQALLASEERMMGRGCTLLGHSALDVGDVRVELVVYEVPPRPNSRHPVAQHRWAVFVDGEPASSSIVKSWAATP